MEESSSLDSVPDALLDMLLCGTRIDGTLMWLESDVGDKGAAKLSQTIKDAIALCEKQLAELVLKQVQELQYMCREMASHCASTAAFQELYPGKTSPFEVLLKGVGELELRIKGFVKTELKEMTLPLISFCHWMTRTQKLLIYEETLDGGDANARLEIEKTLKDTRVSEPYSELVVAEFMKTPDEDWVAPMIALLLVDVDGLEKLRSEAENSMRLKVDEQEIVKVIDMPAEELKKVAFHSDSNSAGGATVVLQRGDYCAMVGWNDAASLPAHAVSVYDAIEGDVVDTGFYKDGKLLVLSYDEDSNASALCLVEDGMEVKQRNLEGHATMLAVGKERGLAAVYNPNHVLLLDVEEDEEEEEEEDEDDEDEE
jgi:hypothetical protein